MTLIQFEGTGQGRINAGKVALHASIQHTVLVNRQGNKYPERLYTRCVSVENAIGITHVPLTRWRMSAVRRARQTASAQELPRSVLETLQAVVGKTSVDRLLATGPVIVRTTMHSQDPPSAEDSC